jgi:hypothetical protein
LDFFEQSQRDIDGAGFALLFTGEVMGGMALALSAMAARAAAAPVDEDQAGGQDGRLRVKLFEPGLELAADEGGMFGDFHVGSRAGSWHGLSDMYNSLSDMTSKIAHAKKYF